MPPSALELLTRLNIEYPMIFKLTNKRTKRQTHCGVLEFVADEGNIYLPHWVCIFSKTIILSQIKKKHCQIDFLIR